MKSIRVDYNKDTDLIEMRNDAKAEDWIDVCENFNNDVHNVREVSDREDYNRLYECFDDNNDCSYYLVKEDPELHKLRRKNFLRKLGRS